MIKSIRGNDSDITDIIFCGLNEYWPYRMARSDRLVCVVVLIEASSISRSDSLSSKRHILKFIEAEQYGAAQPAAPFDRVNLVNDRGLPSWWIAPAICC